jgi:hypothetical protein
MCDLLGCDKENCAEGGSNDKAPATGWVRCSVEAQSAQQPHIVMTANADQWTRVVILSWSNCNTGQNRQQIEACTLAMCCCSRASTRAGEVSVSQRAELNMANAQREPGSY